MQAAPRPASTRRAAGASIPGARVRYQQGHDLGLYLARIMEGDPAAYKLLLPKLQKLAKPYLQDAGQQQPQQQEEQQQQQPQQQPQPQPQPQQQQQLQNGTRSRSSSRSRSRSRSRSSSRSYSRSYSRSRSSCWLPTPLRTRSTPSVVMARPPGEDATLGRMIGLVVVVVVVVVADNDGTSWVWAQGR